MHTMRDGTQIKICDLDDKHLINIINMHRRSAKKGVTVKYGGGEFAGEIWYNEEILYDDDALDELNNKVYCQEAARRGINVN